MACHSRARQTSVFSSDSTPPPDDPLAIQVSVPWPRRVHDYLPEALASQVSEAAVECHSRCRPSLRQRRRLVALFDEALEHIYGRVLSLEAGDCDFREFASLVAWQKDRDGVTPKWFNGRVYAAIDLDFQFGPENQNILRGTLARFVCRAIYRQTQFHAARRRAAERLETLRAQRQPTEAHLYRLRQEYQLQAAEQLRVAEELRKQVAEIAAQIAAAQERPTPPDLRPFFTPEKPKPEEPSAPKEQEPSRAIGVVTTTGEARADVPAVERAAANVPTKKKKGGRRTNWEKTKGIVAAMKKIAGPDWKRRKRSWKSHLLKICTELDAKKVPHPPKWTSWSDQLAGEPELVLKNIAHYIRNQ
jgi:hypothetical protein